MSGLNSMMHLNWKITYFLERLLHDNTQKEQTVLDLFAGWGNMLNVCVENDHKYLGIDIDPFRSKQY